MFLYPASFSKASACDASWRSKRLQATAIRTKAALAAISEMETVDTSTNSIRSKNHFRFRAVRPMRAESYFSGQFKGVFPCLFDYPGYLLVVAVCWRSEAEEII
jgi:hypothetical protein